MYRFNIDPDIAALGRGGGFFIYCFESTYAVDPDVLKHFFRLSFEFQGKGGPDGRQLFIT